MSHQSSLDRLKAMQINRKESRWAVVGAAAGLILGLLIGWVWWPVDWQGGTLDVLSQEEKVDYVATVADAYAAVSTQPGLAQAQQRLAALGDELPALFDAALATYSAQANGGQQVANLAALASALGVTVTALPTVVPLVEAAPAPETAPAAEGGWNWWGILGGMIILVGGGYLGWMLYKRLRASTRPPAGAAGGALHASTPAAPPTVLSAAAPERTPPPAYAAAQAAATKVPPVQPPATAAAPPFDPEDVTPTPTPRSSQPIAPSVAVPSSAPGGFVAEAEATPVVENAAAVGQRPGAATLGWVAGAGRIERYPVVDRLTTHFAAGMENYHITHNITGTDEAYLGEYGVGVSDRYGMLNNDAEQVVAIEVYIFDKSDEKHLVNVSRVLLSEYADTNLRKHFEREKDRLGPIVAQPKTTVQLEARQFVLLCTINEVRYTDDGIFARLDLDLELKKKV